MSNSTRTNQLEESFNYIPNKGASILAGVLFGLLSIALFVRLIRRRNWWGLCLPIGTSAFAAGFFLRYLIVLNPFSFGMVLSEQILIIVAPGAFLAFNYIVYGRLIQTFATNGSRYSLIRPRIVARVFVISDIVTFLAQATGGSMEAQSDTVKVGRTILLSGLIAQTMSYLLYVILLVHSHWRISKDKMYNEDNFPWRLFKVLYFSSALIMIRGIYRTIELSQGNGDGGYLTNHEVFMYVFDTYPLLFATAVYAPFWPGMYIDMYRPKAEDEYTIPLGILMTDST